jgi:hypothetical protein
MAHETILPALTDPAGRLNAALLARGRRAVTTDAAGGIDTAMMIATLQHMGMGLEVSGPDGGGYFTVAIRRPGGDPGGRAADASARSVSRSSAMVEAAIAALTDPPAGAG